MRGGMASIADCGRNASAMLPPNGPYEKAKATTKSSATTARSAHGSRSRNARVRQVAGNAGQPLGHTLLVLAPQRIGENRRGVRSACPTAPKPDCARAGWRARCAGRSRRASAGGRSAADRAPPARRSRNRRRPPGAAVSGISRNRPSQDRLTNSAATSRTGRSSGQSRSTVIAALVARRVRVEPSGMCVAVVDDRRLGHRPFPGRASDAGWRRFQTRKNTINSGKGEARLRDRDQ